MSTQTFGLGSRLGYFWDRLRGFNAASLWDRASAVATAHHRSRVVVLVDMLWSAGFRDTPFQDYVDWDFAMLTRAERASFMTHAISNHLSMTYDQAEYRLIFQDKIEFNRAFDSLLGRRWLDVRESSPGVLQEFVRSSGTVMAKIPVSTSGHGVERYQAKDIDDWPAFHAELVRKGQVLVEEYISQHPLLAGYCAGTVNTTRVTTFFDGSSAHILSMAQKFGRGAASDQQTFGGFYTMLDLDGAAMGPGYDSHGSVHARHPDSGVSIADFRLPKMAELRTFIDAVCRVVPQVQYVGWDVVIGEEGPVLVEGNWGAGVYENKPSVTGIRTGSLPRFREVIGF